MHSAPLLVLTGLISSNWTIFFYENGFYLTYYKMVDELLLSSVSTQFYLHKKNISVNIHDSLISVEGGVNS